MSFSILPISSFLIILLLSFPSTPPSLPLTFVYLKQIDSSILQDIRYAKSYNILGRPLKGIYVDECVLTRKAAEMLSKVQKEVEKFSNFTQKNFTLKVLDCYRPKIANEDLSYSIMQGKIWKKENFAPDLDGLKLIRGGFIDGNHGFARGSTVSVTLSNYKWNYFYYDRDQVENVYCYSDYNRRWWFDFGIDMGTNYDCFDQTSFFNASNNYLHASNRKLLKALMENHGFIKKNELNWWEFVLEDEPYSDMEFDFPVKSFDNVKKEKNISYMILYSNDKKAFSQIYFESPT